MIRLLSLACLLWVASAALPPGTLAPDRPPRPGRVRFVDHAAADGAGQFNAFGASLFAAAHAYKFNSAWLEREAETLSAAGVDYVRALGVVGPESWSDRTIDPRWSDYAEAIAGTTDLLYDRYGLRTQWTIFGGVETTPLPADRARVVDRFVEMARGREHKLFAFEVANEGWQNGFPAAAGIAELQRLGRRLLATGVAVALTSPQQFETGARGDYDACDLYAGWPSLATIHYDRDASTAEGVIRPIRQPWGWPAGYDSECAGQLPRAVASNEPIGPESSVEADAGPTRLALSFVTTFVAKNSAYVFHAGPGVRGGGIEDRKIGRSASYRDLNPAVLKALAAAKQYTPAGLANWTRHNAQWPSAPFAGLDKEIDRGRLVRAYMSTSGDGQIFGVLLGIRQPVSATAREAVQIELLDPATGAVVRSYRLAAGERFTVDRVGDGVVVRGRPLGTR